MGALLPLYTVVPYGMAYLCIEIRKCSIHLTKCKTPCVASTKPYDQLAGMLCYMACHHDHISNHGTQTAAPYLMLCLRPAAVYRLLVYHAEYICRRSLDDVP